MRTSSLASSPQFSLLFEASPPATSIALLWNCKNDDAPNLTRCLFLSEQILGADHLFDSKPMAEFLASCQFKFGGIAKYPGEMPGQCDPSSLCALNRSNWAE